MNARSTALAVVSGVLLAAAFPSIDLPALAWFSLVPLFISLRGQSVVSGFRTGLVFGIVSFTGIVYWVTNSVHDYGHVPLVPASLITLLLAAYCALYPAVFCAAVAFVREKRPALFLLAAPVLWTSLELARTYVFTGFPWALAGYSQYRVLPAIQIADLTGVYGVSFVIVLVNAGIEEFIADRRRYLPLVVAVAATAAVFAYGWLRLQDKPAGNGITVSVVQGNIEQDHKWDPAYQTEVIATYQRLTRMALADKPDLVIWPETATPFYFQGEYGSDPLLTKNLVAFVKQNNVPLLTGSPTYEVMPNRRVVGRNSAFLLAGDGTVVGRYDKIHLVPFGEYVPLQKVLFFVGKMVEAIGDFQGGDVYTVMPVPSAKPGASLQPKVSTAICYEIIFPDLVRRFVNNGANIMTTVTNDAWFGRSAAPYQHFSMAVFRAVENRVPVARAANTGVSGFIDSRGRILAASSIFQEAELTRTLIPGTERTFYTRYGDVFSYACVIASLAMLALLSRKQPVKKKR